MFVTHRYALNTAILCWPRPEENGKATVCGVYLSVSLSRLIPNVNAECIFGVSHSPGGSMRRGQRTLVPSLRGPIHSLLN